MTTSIKTKKTTQVRRATKAARFKDLVAFVQLSFAMFDKDTDLKEISNRTGLSLATCYRLYT